MKANIVIGLGFGDEGKGSTANALISSYTNPIVVRFNGGQQAGHTVINGSRKHIFSNYAVGALSGLDTYLSEHTTFYLPNMKRERDVLGNNPNMIIHPLANVTTPYDVAFNRISERLNKHGSVGLGVGATVARNKGPHKLYAVDLLNMEVFYQKLDKIRVYYDDLLESMSISKNNMFYLPVVEAEMKDFLINIQGGFFNILGYDYLKDHDLIFEGAQGIMLDMDHGIFPNVTYSNTTSKNALEICEKVGISKNDILITYVTRCYQTRHGKGWMSSNKEINLTNNTEEINITNEWQGDFKVKEIDYDLLNYALSVDNIYSEGIGKILSVTCLDQRSDFAFDYTRLKTKFVANIESRSPDSSIKKISFISKI